MTINDLLDVCANIDMKTGFSIYRSLEDFDNSSPHFEIYLNRRALPAYVRNKKISKFELSKYSNTVFIALE